MAIDVVLEVIQPVIIEVGTANELILRPTPKPVPGPRGFDGPQGVKGNTGNTGPVGPRGDIAAGTQNIKVNLPDGDGFFDLFNNMALNANILNINMYSDFTADRLVGYLFPTDRLCLITYYPLGWSRHTLTIEECTPYFPKFTNGGDWALIQYDFEVGFYVVINSSSQAANIGNDFTLNATNGQTSFSVFTIPNKSLLLINGIEYHQNIHYTIGMIGFNATLTWYNQFLLSDTDQIIFRKF
jgi:hypothetical protein